MSTAVVRARAPGYFVREVEPGERVETGAVLGSTFGADARRCDTLRAPHEGHVMYLRRQSRVTTGDAIAAVASHRQGAA